MPCRGRLGCRTQGSGRCLRRCQSSLRRVSICFSAASEAQLTIFASVKCRPVHGISPLRAPRLRTSLVRVTVPALRRLLLAVLLDALVPRTVQAPPPLLLALLVLALVVLAKRPRHRRLALVALGNHARVLQAVGCPVPLLVAVRVGLAVVAAAERRHDPVRPDVAEALAALALARAVSFAPSLLGLRVGPARHERPTVSVFAGVAVAVDAVLDLCIGTLVTLAAVLGTKV